MIWHDIHRELKLIRMALEKLAHIDSTSGEEYEVEIMDVDGLTAEAVAAQRLADATAPVEARLADEQTRKLFGDNHYLYSDEDPRAPQVDSGLV